MGPYLASAFGDESDCGAGNSDRSGGAAARPYGLRRHGLRRASAWAALLISAAIAGGLQPLIPRATAAPDPRVEYLYDVAVRRQYNFPGNDPVGYGYGICDKVSGGEGYAQVMGDVKRDVTPNDEFAANYLVSYAVNLLCPAQIWQLRNSAVHYQPPPGA